MNNNSIDVCYEVLEISRDATIRDVKNAYMQLKKLYSEESIVSEPISSEFFNDNREKILADIVNAYHKIIDHLNPDIPGERASQESPAGDYISDEDCFCGTAIKKTRESLCVELNEIAAGTKISERYLKYIENENFDALPGKVFVRGYLHAYAEFLKLDPVRLINEYMASYILWEKNYAHGSISA